MAETLVTAGKLDKRVNIQSRVSSQDAAGGMQFSYTQFATVWAGIEPARVLGTFRSFGGAQEQENHDTLIQIRYLAGVRSDMRVQWVTPEGSTKTYEVIGVRLSSENRGRWMFLQCIERQGDGWRK